MPKFTPYFDTAVIGSIFKSEQIKFALVLREWSLSLITIYPYRIVKEKYDSEANQSSTTSIGIETKLASGVEKGTKPEHTNI